jgi:hypothetical protein
VQLVNQVPQIFVLHALKTELESPLAHVLMDIMNVKEAKYVNNVISLVQHVQDPQEIVRVVSETEFYTTIP